LDVDFDVDIDLDVDFPFETAVASEFVNRPTAQSTRAPTRRKTTASHLAA